MKKSITIIITLILIFCIDSVYSQSLLEVRGRVSLQEGGSAREGEVKLYEGGSLVQKIDSDRSGKFNINLEIGHDYRH